jgi:hypothetical protein
MKGCICPPTSEQTCKAYDCPRKTAAADVQLLDVPSYNAGVADMSMELRVIRGHGGISVPCIQAIANYLTKPLK